MENELITAAIHSFFMAFGLLMPLGIQNIFIFNQGASHPRLHGAFPSVITASMSDTILITMSVFGVSTLVLKVFWLKDLILIVGFIFLSYMGFVTWRNSNNVNFSDASYVPMPAKEQIFFALSVSFLNPHAIIDTVTVIGANSLSYQGTAKLIFTAGCIIASWSWFLCLSILGNRVSKLKSGAKILVFMNKLSAIIIWSVATYILIRIFNGE